MAAMQEHMIRYFSAEKNESLIFVSVGVLALALGAWLLVRGQATGYRGMAYPLIAIALIQISVGGSVYLRTDAQVAALRAQHERDPAAFRAAEGARMEKVMRAFATYKVAEIVLFAVGVALTYAFRRREGLYAAGIGLIIQSGIMLTLDLFAERRGDAWLAAVRALLE